MRNRKLLDMIFTHHNIDKIKWIFKVDIDWHKTEIELNKDYIVWYKGTWLDGVWLNGAWEGGTWNNGTWRIGIWYDGLWLDGTWEDGRWDNGEWRDGIWKGGAWGVGKIYDHKLKIYRESKVPPNKCKWSSSYGK